MANRCNCPLPPGGVVVCEDNQMAICIIQNDQAIQRCINPPTIEFGTIELVNWALDQILIEKRSLTEQIEQSNIIILRSGEYKSGNYRVTFSLPEKILKALDELDNGFSNYIDNNNDLLIS